MKNKKIFVIMGGVLLLTVVLLSVIELIFKETENEVKEDNSIIFFYDTENKEVIFYENDVRKDFDLKCSDNSYYLDIGSQKDAFFVVLDEGHYIYYNDKIKKIQIDEENDGSTYRNYWVSPTAKSIVYICDEMIYLYNAITAKTEYICDLDGRKSYEVIDDICFSADGDTILFSSDANKYGYASLWIYNNGKFKKLKDEEAKPIVVTNNGNEIIYAERVHNNGVVIQNKLIKKNGKEEVIAIGEMQALKYMNNAGSEFIFTVYDGSYYTKEYEYPTYLYNNGEVTKLSNAVLRYFGKEEDRDFTGMLYYMGIAGIKSPGDEEYYVGQEKSLLDAYYLYYDFNNDISRNIAYVDENMNVDIVVNKKVSTGFSVNEDGKYLYYGIDSDGYCLTGGEEHFLISNIKDIDNYKGVGTYILADYDYDERIGTLYYCNDGKILQHVMDGVSYISVQGNYVYIMINTSGDMYDVYRGNSEEGYNKIETDVYYENLYGVIM